MSLVLVLEEEPAVLLAVTGETAFVPGVIVVPGVAVLGVIVKGNVLGGEIPVTVVARCSRRARIAGGGINLACVVADPAVGGVSSNLALVVTDPVACTGPGLLRAVSGFLSVAAIAEVVLSPRLIGARSAGYVSLGGAPGAACDAPSRMVSNLRGNIGMTAAPSSGVGSGFTFSLLLQQQQKNLGFI